MINVDVVIENNLWKKKIRNPKLYLKKKIKKIIHFFPSRKKILFSFNLHRSKHVGKISIFAL